MTIRPDVLALLHNLEPAAAETCTWGNGMRLEISAFITDRLPPVDLVSSVRSLLWLKGDLMLMTSRDGSQHVLPGGRCEPGETLQQTLQRELAEETGWQADTGGVLGFLRLLHLSPKPDGFPYPYPVSFQVVYTSTATAPLAGPHSIEDEWEQEGHFVSVADVRAATLAPTDLAFLQAASPPA